MPVSALTTTMTSAVANVSFRACQANGSRSASPERRDARPGRLDDQRRQRQDDHQPEVEERRSPQARGPIAPPSDLTAPEAIGGYLPDARSPVFAVKIESRAPWARTAPARSWPSRPGRPS